MSDLCRKLLLALLLIGSLASTISAQTVTEAQPPMTAEQYVVAGDSDARTRQHDQAVDPYRQASRLNPNLAAAYHGLGRVYVNMGRATDAIAPLQTAARLDANNSVVHVNPAIAFEDLRRVNAAL